MTLIQHPGSDRQAAVISIDTGLARDITLMLTDAHALIEALASGQAPAAARQAAAALRDAASLAAALDQTATWLHQARRTALAGLRPAP